MGLRGTGGVGDRAVPMGRVRTSFVGGGDVGGDHCEGDVGDASTPAGGGDGGDSWRLTSGGAAVRGDAGGAVSSRGGKDGVKLAGLTLAGRVRRAIEFEAASTRGLRLRGGGEGGGCREPAGACGVSGLVTPCSPPGWDSGREDC